MNVTLPGLPAVTGTSYAVGNELVMVPTVRTDGSLELAWSTVVPEGTVIEMPSEAPAARGTLVGPRESYSKSALPSLPTVTLHPVAATSRSEESEAKRRKWFMPSP